MQTTMKPTVIHLTCQHCSFDDRIYHKEARSLAFDYNVILLANSPDQMIHDMSGNKLDPATFEGVQQETYCLSGNKYFQYAKMRIPKVHASIIIKRIEELGLQPQLIHFHDLELLPVGKFLKKRFNCKLIFDVHEMFPAYPLDRNRFPLSDVKSYFIFKMMKSNFKYLDAIISTSEPIWILNSLLNIEIPNIRIFNTSMFERGARSDTAGNHGKVVLVHEGSLPFNRGLSLMCDIFTDEWIRENVVLKIVGRIKGKEAEYLQKRIEIEPWLKESIIITGWVDYLKVPENLTGDIGIIFFEKKYNNMNCIPNKLFNYISAGLPVIVTHTPAMTPIVERYEIGLTVSRDSAAIKKAIDEIIVHKDKFKEKVDKAAQIFNWHVDEGRLICLYQELFGNNIGTKS